MKLEYSEFFKDKLNNVTIEYIFCLSEWFKYKFDKHPKYQIWKKIFKEYNIEYYFEKDYLNKIIDYINNFV